MSRSTITPGFAEEGLPTFLFSFDDFEKMDEAGLFRDRGRGVELIEGKLVEMAPPGMDHTKAASHLHGQLYIAISAGAPTGFEVLTQGTLKIGDHSGPQPDVFVARSRAGERYYLAEDCVLVIEVAVTSVTTDKTIKRPLYARAGIAEFWLVEPEARTIRVHRKPGPSGEWGEEVTVAEGVVRPAFAPEIAIALSDIFRDA
jgi:Uma2 family endonuclease